MIDLLTNNRKMQAEFTTKYNNILEEKRQNAPQIKE